jgi:purine-nucleoside phosphorylase
MDFKKYFRTAEKNIRPNCIICQSFDVSLFTDKTSSGLFVKYADAGDATVIALKNNFLAGDAILHLGNTKCKNIFLFGKCGGFGSAGYGDLIAVDKAYNLESFSKMLNRDKNPEYYQSSKDLLSDFYKKNCRENLMETNSACVGSLALESNFSDWFKEKKISAVDMESSIILSAAKEIKRNAVCFMYVTDLVGRGFTADIGDESLKRKTAASRKKLADMILRFCNEK